MTENKKNEKNKGKEMLAAGVTGAVIGAGVTAAATKIITDKKAQKAIKDKASEIKTGVKEAMEAGEKQVAKTKKDLKKETKK